MKVKINTQSNRIVSLGPAAQGGGVPVGGATGTGSGAATASNLIYKKYVIRNPAVTWTINHNIGTDKFQAFLRDVDGNVVYAGIKTINTSSFQVYFTTAISGSVDVLFDTASTDVVNI